jgi:hypothetical protein
MQDLKMHVTAASLAVLIGSGGCSWAFMSKPPKTVLAPNFPVDCTSSRAAPVLDSICSGYFIANAAVLAGSKTCSDNIFDPDNANCVDADTKSAGTVLSVGLAAICGVAAFNGYKSASRCAALKAQNVGCIGGDPQACQALAPGWRPGATYQPIIPFPLQPPATTPAPSPVEPAPVEP